MQYGIDAIKNNKSRIKSSHAKSLILVSGLCLVISSACAAPTAVQPADGPKGGWNYSGLTDRSTDSNMSYPTPPIYRGLARNRTPIKGTIPLADQQIPELIVNGNAMRLNTDKSGHFERFYAFGGGSNSIEVRASSNKTGHRTQFYESNPSQVTPQLRIICSWDAPEAEVDLHILTPDRQHITYSSPFLKEGGGLDVDSVDGPGPEMFTTPSPMHGTYQVYVNYWGNLDEEGYNFDKTKLKKPIITSTITLVFNENTPNEKRESFIVPLRKIGELTMVKSFIY